MPDPIHDLYDVIARRRDVRAEFAGRPPTDAVLHRVLAAAHAAPSVGHTQPWDFVLVRDLGLRDAFAAHVATEREVFASSLSVERAETFSRIKVEGVRESGLGVVVTYDPSRGGPHVLGRHAIADAGLYSSVLAIQNLWLAATAEGLGVGWVSFYREEFLAELLGVPEGVRPLAWLCVGEVTGLQDRPDLERHGWRQRRPLEEAVHCDRYGSGGL
ncbi:5,6-dimethylbenzimidazole synthase [Marmoricola endophyticus]|uniref:5,6-dimethylbenzimidazole synthase n=1 Tax=Marmoricola endophyticus TaxID=2040280 RepID=A0A917BUW4_9ACTN|nr:5,6-dimethylbenzimidazole synthase [Marmoricola endophyticus]GGF57705.1 5,6-dimethylbenzimidazole synthase [Marmoricola endophyticus]